MTLAATLLPFRNIQGYVSPLAVVDALLVVAAAYFLKAFIIPAVILHRKSKYLDQLAGTTPKHWFYGHMLEYPNNEKGMLKTLRRALKFPTMFSHWVSPFMAVLQLYHSDTVVSLLASGAPKDSLAYKFIRPWIGDGLLTSKGAKWRRNRRLLTPAFHFSVLKGYTDIFNECADVMLQKWTRSTRKPLDVAPDVCLMTLDSMLQCTMSSETDCDQTRGNHPYIKAVREMTQLIITRIDKPYLLRDFIFWRTSYGRRFHEAAQIVHKHAEEVISKRRKYIQKCKGSNANINEVEKIDQFFHGDKKHLDFLDILLQTRDEEGNGLTDREIRDEVDTFLFEGHDTAASGISWALYNLAKYPEFQEKCRSEVEIVLNGRQRVKWDDLSQFKYLTMFIKESLRMYPPVPAIGRELEGPLDVRSSLNKPQNCSFASKTSVFLLIFTLHRNPLLWKNPEEFDPERFSKENVSKISTYSYLPFSAGQRNCIGQNFAMNEMKIVLAQTLSRYKLHLDDETPEPEMLPIITLQSANGIFVKLESLNRDS